MKIGFIGCVESSYKALEALLNMKNDNIEVIAVITKEASKVNSDFVDLSPLCHQHNVPVHYEKLNDKQESLSFFRRYSPDVIYCFGWSYLLKSDMLELAPIGAIGYHPAPLPLARGRHPIIWALTLGLETTASTFFKMDTGADSGPVLSQVKINILPDDNATSLYNKLIDTAVKQIVEFTIELANQTAVFKTQDDSKATYWRKRSRTDGLIDWRMRASDIYNLVRALASPYPGAECIHENRYIVINKVEVDNADYPNIFEPGKVLDVDKDRVLVKCGGKSALWVYNNELASSLNAGDYL